MMNKKGQEYLGAVIGIGFVVVFIIGVILLAMGYDTVAANHLGVMNTMGELKGVMNPGFKFTGFFTNVVSYDMRIRKVKVDMLTEQSSASDNTGQVIFGSVSVNYKIKYSTDVVTKLYQQIGTDEQIEDKLNIVAIIKEGFKQATVKHEAMDILQNRQQVKEEAIANIRKNFPTDYLEIDQIVVEDIDFTPGFKKAIDDKKIATQNKLKEQEQVQVVMFQQQQEIEKYKAEAEKLRLQKSQITPMLIQQQMISRWDGKLPSYLIMPSNSEGMGMLMQLAKGDISAVSNGSGE